MEETRKTMTVGTTELAEILGMTDSRIRQLERSGIISKIGRGKYDLKKAVQSYCKYLKASVEKQEGLSEKDLLDRARCKKIELEIQVLQGDLHRAEDVERVMNDMLGAYRSRCLSIPYKLAPQLVSITDISIIQAAIKKEVYEALTELSNYDPSVFYAHSKDKLALGSGEEDQKEQRKSHGKEGT